MFKRLTVKTPALIPGDRGSSPYTVSIITAIIICLQAGAAWGLPPTVEAGRLEKSQEAPQAPRSQAESPPESGIVSVQAPPGAENLHFVLQKIVIKGATRYPATLLLQDYADWEGKDITLKQIYDAASAIMRRYHSDGYIFSYVYLPPQQIIGGRVTLHVVEGSITRIIAEGLPPGPNNMIELLKKRLMGMRPLDAQRMQEDLLLLNDLPGMRVKGVLEPDQEAAREGALVLRLIGEHQPITANASVDNYGSRYLGPWQGAIQTQFNGQLRDYDHVTLTGNFTLHANEQRYFAIQYNWPINLRTRLSVSGSKSHSEPGYTLKEQEIRNDAKSLRGDLRYNWIRSRLENLTVSGTLELRNLKTDILGVELSRDHIRTLRFSTTYDTVDRWNGVDLITVGIGQGLNIAGARKTGSQNLSRAEGHSDFTKMEATALRTQNIGNALNLYTVVTGQYAWSPLLASEEFAFGGAYLGRAYDLAEITGDHGIAGAAEIRYLQVPEWKSIKTQPFLFYDVGRVWNLDTGGKDNSAASMGVGLRTQRNNLHGSLVVGWPLTRRPTTPLSGEAYAPRVGLSLSCQF